MSVVAGLDQNLMFDYTLKPQIISSDTKSLIKQFKKHMFKKEFKDLLI